MITNSFIATVESLFNTTNTSELNLIETDITGLSVLRAEATTSFQSVVYTPLICLILQGSKETVAGDESVSFAAGQSLIISHDLPVNSRIIDASPAQPYLALVFMLDIATIRSLYDEIGETYLAAQTVQALGVGSTEPELVRALERLVNLADRPLEAKVIAPLIKREIHFRLLLAEHGGMLRRLLRRESHASRISKAISLLGERYTNPLSVPELANTVGMSVSSFHQHFKSITATTPLQYQKNLRLIEAQRLLVDGAKSVASVAYDVGYESLSQFSREYSRKFQMPPSTEISKNYQQDPR